MNKQASKKKDQPLEGEGSYSAARRYNRGLGDAVATGDLAAGAEQARRALDGSEGKELRRAAAQAKKGPKQSATTAAKAAARK